MSKLQRSFRFKRPEVKEKKREVKEIPSMDPFDADVLAHLLQTLRTGPVASKAVVQRRRRSPVVEKEEEIEEEEEEVEEQKGENTVIRKQETKDEEDEEDDDEEEEDEEEDAVTDKPTETDMGEETEVEIPKEKKKKPTVNPHVKPPVKPPVKPTVRPLIPELPIFDPKGKAFPSSDVPFPRLRRDPRTSEAFAVTDNLQFNSAASLLPPDAAVVAFGKIRFKKAFQDIPSVVATYESPSSTALVSVLFKTRRFFVVAVTEIIGSIGGASVNWHASAAACVDGRKTKP